MNGLVVKWLVLSAFRYQQASNFRYQQASRPIWGLSVWSLNVLAVPAYVSSEHSNFLPQPKDMQARSIGYSELPIGVNVSVVV